MAKNMEGIQLFYDWMTINITPSSLAGRIKKLNGQHTAPGPYFVHACSKLEFCPNAECMWKTNKGLRRVSAGS